ncbi:hypothetical protein CVS40_2452 [Lucilia cuprina]|nr:hypothetical protein CVS40_2452 [Lucilia cuprina]
MSNELISTANNRQQGGSFKSTTKSSHTEALNPSSRHTPNNYYGYNNSTEQRIENWSGRRHREIYTEQYTKTQKETLNRHLNETVDTTAI